jgi:hypothetical protein
MACQAVNKCIRTSVVPRPAAKTASRGSQPGSMCGPGNRRDAASGRRNMCLFCQSVSLFCLSVSLSASLSVSLSSACRLVTGPVTRGADRLVPDIPPSHNMARSLG